MLQDALPSNQAVLCSIAENSQPSELISLLQGFVIGHMGVPLTHPLIPPILSSFKDYEGWIENGLLSMENAVNIFLAATKHVGSHHNREDQDYDHSLVELRNQVETYLNQVLEDPNFFRDNKGVSADIYDPTTEVLMSLDLVETECQICCTPLKGEEAAVLECTHSFHIECMHHLLKQKIEDGQVDSLKCPDQKCGIQLSNNQILMFLTPQLEEKYQKFQQNRYVQVHGQNTSWCPTPNCPVMFEHDPEVEKYDCKSCNKSYCLKCRQKFHDGISCEQYKTQKEMTSEDRQFIHSARGAKFKQCPKCKFWVERSTGCSHMTCRCGEHFCYNCGKVRGNRGCTC